jgi:hypothetical protein
LTFQSAPAAATGSQYRCLVTSAIGTTISTAATLTVNATLPSTPKTGVDPAPVNTGRLINISTRSLVGTQGDVQIAGFVIAGNTSKRVLIRASGPTLADFGVAGALVDPVLTLTSGSTVVAKNDDWDPTLATEFARVGAFAWKTGSKDAALEITLHPGAYTVQVNGKNDSTGVALIEVYDADDTAAGGKLINLSTRSLVGTGDNVQIGGFIVRGNSPMKVVIRAVGPALTGYGVPGALADPILSLYSGQTLVAQNDNWDPTLAPDFAAVGAFALTPGSNDAALVVTLQPGAYTAQVNGKNGGTGVALVEIYEAN